MALVAAKCTNCGAALEVDRDKNEAICPFCQTTFIVENAINNYISETHNHIGNIDHADIHVHDEKSLENRISSAETFLTLHKDYDKALKMYQEIADDAPGDYRSWWGVVRAMTHEFTGYTKSEYVKDAEAFRQVKTNMEYAMNAAGEEDRDRIRSAWMEYEQQYNKYIEKLEALREPCDAAEKRLYALNVRHSDKAKECDANAGRLRIAENSLKSLKKRPFFVTLIIRIVLFIAIAILGRFALVFLFNLDPTTEGNLILMSACGCTYLLFSILRGTVKSGGAKRIVKRLKKEQAALSAELSNIKDEMEPVREDHNWYREKLNYNGFVEFRTFFDSRQV